MFKKAFQTLQQRLHTPDKLTVPWELQWLPIILIVLEVVVFFLALLMVTTLMDASFDTADPLVMTRVYLLSSLLTLILTAQYAGQYVVNAREEKRIKGDVTLWEWLYLNPSTTTPLWGVVLLAFALAVVLDTIGLAIGVSETSLPTPLNGLSENQDPLTFLLAAFVLVLLRPIVDEIIFRGVLYPALAKQMTPWMAIGVAATAYAALHYLLDPQSVWWGLVVPFVVGWLAGIARASAKSTQTAIGVNAMFGLFAVLRAIVS